MLVFKVVVLIFIFGNQIFVRSYEYCSKEVKLCQSHVDRHIVCFKEQIEPDSEYVKHYPMTILFRDSLLYWHNYYRNLIAEGKLKGADGILPGATRLRELVWDYELEYIAKIHSGQCAMKHDKCRNTDRFPFGGQNLGYFSTTAEEGKPLERGKASITHWFIEHTDVPLSCIKHYGKVEGKKIGHFTVMANDRVGRLGCAMAFCEGFPDKKGFKYNYITCNYDYTNIRGTEVYQQGQTASNCGHYGVGKSSNFSFLCASNHH